MLLTKIWGFACKNWCDILSLIFSVTSIAFSIISYRRTNEMRNQSEQEPLCKDITKLIEARSNFYSSEEKIIGVMQYPTISGDEEEQIKRRTKRFFGKCEYNLLCNLLKKAKNAKEIDADIGILFDLIQEANPDSYEKLRDALMSENENGLDDSVYEDNKTFFRTITIPYYEVIPNKQGKAYDYLKLSSKRETIRKEIAAIQANLEKQLQKAMLKR